MKLSAKIEYAAIAVMELAAQYDSGEPVRIRSIADEHGIPQRFLVQILLQLKAAGLVASTRGATGGYRLTRPPDEISLADVQQVIEGPQQVESNSPAASTSLATGVLLDAWREVADTKQALLAEVSFADLLGRMRQTSEHMYYI